MKKMVVEEGQEITTGRALFADGSWSIVMRSPGDHTKNHFATAS